MPIKLLDDVISMLRRTCTTAWQLRDGIITHVRNYGCTQSFADYVGDAYLEDIRNNPQSSTYPHLIKAWGEIRLPY
jgi:hypothetical protein